MGMASGSPFNTASGFNAPGSSGLESLLQAINAQHTISNPFLSQNPGQRQWAMQNPQAVQDYWNSEQAGLASNAQATRDAVTSAQQRLFSGPMGAFNQGMANLGPNANVLNPLGVRNLIMEMFGDPSGEDFFTNFTNLANLDPSNYKHLQQAVRNALLTDEKGRMTSGGGPFLDLVNQINAFRPGVDTSGGGPVIDPSIMQTGTGGPQSTPHAPPMPPPSILQQQPAATVANQPAPESRTLGAGMQSPFPNFFGGSGSGGFFGFPKLPNPFGGR